MKKIKDARLGVRISQNDLNDLKKLAEFLEISMSEIIQTCVWEKIQKIRKEEQENDIQE